MNEATPAAGNAAANDKDLDIISKIIKFNTDKRLIWNGTKPDGTKNQYWENGAPDLAQHITDKKIKHGANLAFEKDGVKVAQNFVIDVDKVPLNTTNKEFSKLLFSLDSKAIPFRSPSGTNFHVWYFYPEPVKVEVAAAAARALGHKIAAHGYTIDFGKCNPTKSGSNVGINLPFGSAYQQPLDPRGNQMSVEKLYQRLRFNNFPYIAAVINLPSGKNRHDALLYSLAQLWQSGKFKEEYIDYIKDSFYKADISEEWFDRVILTNKDYKTYQLADNTIEEKIGDLIDVEDFKFTETPTKEIEDVEEIIEPLEVKTYSAAVAIKSREWVIKGVCLRGAATSISAAPGSGKTTSGAQLAYSINTGKQFYGYDVYESGNVLMIVNEETENEINIKLKAIETEYGLMDSQYKIDIRTVEDVTKFAEFRKGKATPTTQYKQLEKAIEKHNYKLVYVDPLISIKSGEFDENSNDNMETLIKDFVIKLAVKFNIPVVVAHHTNKIHVNAFDDSGDQVTFDNLSMQNAARGASSLMGAVRAGFVMMNMPKKLWEDHYEEIAGESYNRNSLVGMFDAKSNYSAIGDKPLWLDKKVIKVPTSDGMEAETVVLKVSDLNQMIDASYQTYVQKNNEKIISLMPDIKKFFELDQDKMEKIAAYKMQPISAALNELSTWLYKKDPQFQNKQVKASTLNSRYKRLLEQVQTPVEIPNSKLHFKYFYDRYESKTKHKVIIEPIKSRLDDII